MFRRLFLSLAIFFGVLIAAQSVPAPQIDDYQSKTSGTWNVAGTWQIYTANGWTDATTYPGQGTTVSSQGNYRVYIQAGHDVSFTADATYYFADIYVMGSPIPNPTTIGKITLNTGITVKFLGADQDIFLSGGAIVFNGNNTVLGMGANSSLVISDFNGNLDGSGGTNGVRVLTANNCTGNQQITFYNTNGNVARMYAVCNGNNSDYNFDDLNASGGSIYVIPKMTPAEVCAGQSATFSGTYTGFIVSGRVINWAWSQVSGPTVSQTLPSGSGTHTISNGVTTYVPISPVTITNLQEGTYEFKLTVWYYYSGNSGYQVTSSENIIVTVHPLGSAFCACYPNPATGAPGTGNQSNFGITAFGRATTSATDTSSWPLVREGGALVLEAESKGFVINRVNGTSAIANAVEGMIVYDLSDNKMKIYSLKQGDAAMGWHSFETPTCPTN